MIFDNVLDNFGGQGDDEIFVSRDSFMAPSFGGDTPERSDNKNNRQSVKMGGVNNSMPMF